MKLLKDKIRHSKSLIMIIITIIMVALCSGCGKTKISFQTNDEGIARSLIYANDIEIDSEVEGGYSLTYII